MRSLALLIVSTLVSMHLLHAQCEPKLTYPSDSLVFSDDTADDVLLWNAPYWLNHTTQSHNLAETACDLKIHAHDFCGTGITTRFKLELDLDGDGSAETLIDSETLSSLPAGKLEYNNLTPGISSLRAFDNRTVAPDQLYRFALIDELTAMDHHDLRIVWTTKAEPGKYVAPQLPYGKHKITWFVRDDNDDESVISYSFKVTGSEPPKMTCLNGLSVNVMPAGKITLYATDVLLDVEDDNTPANQVQIGIRKSGTGSGFPVDATGKPVSSVEFSCSDLGLNQVELWVQDADQNTAFCETLVKIQDNKGICPSGKTGAVVCAVSTDNSQICELDITYTVTAPGGAIQTYNQLGCLSNFHNQFPTGPVTVSLKGGDSNPLNGVTTYDNILILRHILGYNTLTKPYQLLAADVNNSGTVTVADVLENYRIILGNVSQYPSGINWKFVDAAYVFPNPQNPFIDPYPTGVTIADPTATATYKVIAIKVGNVNASAICTASTPRSALLLNVKDRLLRAGETVQIPVTVSSDLALLGFQFELAAAPGQIKVEDVTPHVPDFSTENSYKTPQGGVLFSWASAEPVKLKQGSPLLTLSLHVMADVRLSEVLKAVNNPALLPEIYTDDLNIHRLNLSITDQEIAVPIFGKPQPNPTASQTLVPVQLPEATEVNWKLMDLTGRLLMQGVTQLAAGTGQLELPTTDIAKPGIYLYQLQSNLGTAGGRIEIIR